MLCVHVCVRCEMQVKIDNPVGQMFMLMKINALFTASRLDNVM